MTDTEVTMHPNFKAVPETVALTEPPEVRALLIKELEQIQKESQILKDSEPTPGMFAAVGLAFGGGFGLFLANVVNTATGGHNPGLASGEGLVIGNSMGVAVGAGIDVLLAGQYSQYKKVMDMRNEHFKQNVWNNIPRETQLSVNKKLTDQLESNANTR